MCSSVTLDIPERREMTKQIDWRAKQPSQVACFSEDRKYWGAWYITCGYNAKRIGTTLNWIETLFPPFILTTSVISISSLSSFDNVYVYITLTTSVISISSPWQCLSPLSPPSLPLTTYMPISPWQRLSSLYYHDNACYLYITLTTPVISISSLFSLDNVCVYITLTTSVISIGRFGEAGLLEWMRFVIFRTRRRERSQRTSRPISE